MKLFRVHRSRNGIVMILGDSGTFIPPEIAAAMTAAATNSASLARWLIDLCGDATTDTPALRDAGMVATLVSPLVVDAMKPLGESSNSAWKNQYHDRTEAGEAIYRDPSFTLSPTEHTLRRETFYLPFHGKIDSEISRAKSVAGRALAVVIRFDPSPHRRIACRLGSFVKLVSAFAPRKHATFAERKPTLGQLLVERSLSDLFSIAPATQSQLIQQASEIGNTLTFCGKDSGGSATANFDQVPQRNLNATETAWCEITISAGCFIQDELWSASRGHATRQTLDAIFEFFVSS